MHRKSFIRQTSIAWLKSFFADSLLAKMLFKNAKMVMVGSVDGGIVLQS
jgi:hypothetical protein